MRNAFYLLIILLCFCPITFAQEQQPPQQPPPPPQQPPPQQQQIAVPEQPGVTEAAVQEQLEEHHFRLGIFRLQPHFGFNSGYDSNALYTQNEVIGDYFMSAVPAIRVGLKLGQHAFLDIGDEVEFLYYKKLSQRRDIFNSTTALFSTVT